jgi:hypothetical protein
MFSTRLTISHVFEPDTPEAAMMKSITQEFIERLNNVGTEPMVECFINLEPVYWELNGIILEEV